MTTIRRALKEEVTASRLEQTVTIVHVQVRYDGDLDWLHVRIGELIAGTVAMLEGENERAVQADPDAAPLIAVEAAVSVSRATKYTTAHVPPETEDNIDG